MSPVTLTHDELEAMLASLPLWNRMFLDIRDVVVKYIDTSTT
jgi:hypothetical protein